VYTELPAAGEFFKDLRSSVGFGAFFQQWSNPFNFEKSIPTARRRRIFLKICDLQSDLEHFPSNVATWSNRFHFEEGVLNCLPQANFLRFAMFGRIWSTFPAM
jgi:hypothetical protein